MNPGYYAELSFSGDALQGKTAILYAESELDLGERIRVFAARWNDRGNTQTITVNKFHIALVEKVLPTQTIQFPLNPV